jgi:DNA repair photolyase
MVKEVSQTVLFDDIAESASRTPSREGAQADIAYFGALAQSVLNTPEATGMGYWSINPYVGCAFGCAYCYARFTHRYVTDRTPVGDREPLPPWLAFERRIIVKRNAPKVLRDTLRHGSDRLQGLIKGEALVIGTATDPYQPAERRFRITRGILEVLAEHGDMRIDIITKGPLVTRDIDLLKRISRQSRLRVNVSLITVDRALARRIEPRTATPDARLRAAEKLVKAGIDVGINVAPVLPGVTDDPAALDALLARIAAAGVTHIFADTLRLRSDARKVYLPVIEAEFPELGPRYRATYAKGHSVGDRYRAGMRRVLARLCAAHGIRYPGARSRSMATEEEKPDSEQLGLAV